MSRVLVIEDDTHIRDLIVLHLGLEGLETAAVGDGLEGLARAGSEPFDLVVLGLMLPGMDGVSICRATRRDGPNQDVPIMMLTARREESDKVLGLESGADDYLAKPLGIRELVARVRALLRRPRRSLWQWAGPAKGSSVTFGRPLMRPIVAPFRKRHSLWKWLGVGVDFVGNNGTRAVLHRAEIQNGLSGNSRAQDWRFPSATEFIM